MRGEGVRGVSVDLLLWKNCGISIVRYFNFFREVINLDFFVKFFDILFFVIY